MTRLRQTIARRLKEAQDTAAMLTTFNEVDMSAVMALRSEYKDVFEKRHGVKLGFMSFFVKACVAGAEGGARRQRRDRRRPTSIYKNHYDIGVAVGTDKGLVVPVVRDADALSLADIEKAIGGLGKKARDGDADPRRPAGRHLHHLQRRDLWLADVDADPERRRSRASWACTTSRSAPWRSAARWWFGR